MNVNKRAPKKITIDYQKGKIYKIVNEINDMIFVGSTTTNLRNRLHEDKKSLDKDITGYQIILIENFPCDSKAELNAREYELKKGLQQDLLTNPARKNVKPTEERFRIVDDNDGQQFRIRWNDNDGEKQEKKFRYKAKEKAEQREAAEKYRQELIAIYK